MDLLYECAACHLPLDRERVHYGGMSCYSCRAFFRRKTQKNDLTKCHLKQECKISYIERKSCPPCRYEKCLRAGMRTDLVLNDDEKRKRFQKYLRQTTEESDDEENDFEMVGVIKTTRKRTIPDQQKKMRGKQDAKSSQSKIKVAPNYRSSTCSFEMVSATEKESDYETDDPWEIPKPDGIEESGLESTEECFLDPETGLLDDPSSNKEKEMIHNGKEGQDSDLSLPTVKAKSNSFTAYKYAGEATFPMSTQAIVDSSNSLPTKARGKKIIHTEETQILKYVNVAPGKNVSPFVDCGETSGSNEDILNTFLHHHNDIYQHHHEHLHEHPHEHLHEHPHEHTPCQPRKSVIVNQIFNEEVIFNEKIDQVVEEVEGFQNDAECIKIANSLTIKEVQNMFTLEEEAYLCRNPKTLPENYFTENNKIKRERLLNTICASEDMGLLSTNCRNNLLKRNIPTAELLLHIVGYHFTNEEDLMDFALGDKDLSQWKDRATWAPWLSVEASVSYVPFSETVKRALDKTMRFDFQPILHDRHVLAIMVMMVIFSQGEEESVPEVVSLLSQYWTMLRRYLTTNMFEDVEETLSYLSSCLKNLPILLDDNFEALVEIL